MINLILAGLIEKRHCSGRHLQNLFERYDYIPMLLVGEQYLSFEMKRFQATDINDTMTSIVWENRYLYNLKEDLDRLLLRTRC